MSTHSAASSADYDVDVAVVGGGPGGVSLAYLLGKYGVRVAVYEKENQLPASPRGQHAHPTTAELWRSWGVLDRLESADHGAGWDLHRQQPESFWGSIASGALLQYPSVQQQEEEQRLLATITPEDRVLSATYQYVPLIADQASRFDGVELHPGVEVTGLTQEDDGVRLVAAGPGANVGRSPLATRWARTGSGASCARASA